MMEQAGVKSSYGFLCSGVANLHDCMYYGQQHVGGQTIISWFR